MIHTDGTPTIAHKAADAILDGERLAKQVEPLVPRHRSVKPLDVLGNGATVIAVGTERADTTLVLAWNGHEYASWWLDGFGHCYHGHYERGYEAAFADFTARCGS